MSTLPQRQVGVFVTVALAVVGAVVAAIILLSSSKASGVELSSADFVPKDAGLYVAINSDLSSSQWVAAFKLIERLGEKDPQGQLKSTASDSDVDWENEVVPFLGGNAAVYMNSFSITTTSFDGAVIIKCKDANKALHVVEDRSGYSFAETNYKGVKYEAAEDTDIFVATIDGHLIVTSDEDAMFDVIDTHADKGSSIASSQDFKNLRDELTDNFLAFLYLNTESLVGNFLGDSALHEAIDQSGAGDLAFKPLAFVIGANGDAFEYQAASLGDPGVVTPMVKPRTSALVNEVPAKTSIFFSTFDIASTYHEAIKQAGSQIDDAVAQEGEYSSLADALQGEGQKIGLDSIEDIIDLFTGETAVALWFPTQDSDEPDGVLIAQVDDEGHARDIVQKVFESSSDSDQNLRTDKINGVDVVVSSNGGEDEAAYAVHDGKLYLGTFTGVSEALSGKSNLAGDATYKKAVSEMPTKLGTYAYFDLSAVLSLAEGGIPAELDDAQAALEAAIINVVDERDVVRESGVLTVR